MHKSRLGSLIIDCKTEDLDREAAFWSAALGCRVIHRNRPGDEIYRGLSTEPAHPKMLVQQVDHASRVHLDIETDDIEKEVQRLLKLGAKKVARVKDWWVLQAPTGQRFCVVKPQRKDFEQNANQWD